MEGFEGSWDGVSSDRGEGLSLLLSVSPLQCTGSGVSISSDLGPRLESKRPGSRREKSTTVRPRQLYYTYCRSHSRYFKFPFTPKHLFQGLEPKWHKSLDIVYDSVAREGVGFRGVGWLVVRVIELEDVERA